MFPTCALWGAFDAAEMLGVIAVRDGWIDQLYVLRRRNGEVWGASFYRLLSANLINSLTFQRNILARCFYEARGFILDGNCWRPQRGKGARRAVPLGAPRVSVSPQEMPCLEATRKAGAWCLLRSRGSHCGAGNRINPWRLPALRCIR
jgi:hypothetical protein